MAVRTATMQFRVAEDDLNDSKRPRIGMTASEKAIEEATSLLHRGQFDVPGKKKGRISLAELSRYDLIKSRLW